MTYKITIRVYQTNPNAFFNIVEKTVYHFANGGTWTESNGEHVLTMGGSGTSGTLRFMADNGEIFLVAVGVHDWKRWCDIVTDLAHSQTGVTIHTEYYNGKRHAVDKQLSSYSISNANGRKFEVNFTVADGNDLRANIIIG